MRKIVAICVLHGLMMSMACAQKYQEYVTYNERRYRVEADCDIKTLPTVRIHPVDEEKLKHTAFPMKITVDGFTFPVSVKHDEVCFPDRWDDERCTVRGRDNLKDTLLTANIVVVDSAWLEPLLSNKRRYVSERLTLLDEAEQFIANIREYKGEEPSGEMQRAVFEAFKDLYRNYNINWDEGNNLKNREIIANLIKKKKFVKGLEGEPQADLLEKIHKEKTDLRELAAETDWVRLYTSRIPYQSLPMDEDTLAVRYGKMSDGFLRTKQLPLTFRNPFLLPAIDIKNPHYEGAFYAVWGWLKNARLERVETSYPVKESYYVSSEHPGMKVYGSGIDPWRYVVKDGQLLYVLEQYNIDSARRESDAIMDYVLQAAYKANRYNIASESRLVQKILKMKLGLEKAPAAKAMNWAYLLSPSTHPVDKMSLCKKMGLNYTVFDQAYDKANDFIEQIEKDYGSLISKQEKVQTSELEYTITMAEGKVVIRRTYYLDKQSLCHKMTVVKMELEF